MALKPLNPDNGLTFGSDNDRLYLGPYPTDLSSIVGLQSEIPAGLIDCGWISEDGVELGLSDSGKKIKGHQGHGVVKAFVDESETSIVATVLESKVEIFKWYFDVRKAEKIQENGEDIGRFELPSSRKAVDLCGVADFITTDTGKHIRKVYEKLTLTEREGITFKIGEITAYKFTLEVIKPAIVFTNIPSLIPS